MKRMNTEAAAVEGMIAAMSGTFEAVEDLNLERGRLAADVAVEQGDSSRRELSVSSF